eukprot:TRINITY_DN11471_c0_g1_i4.p1 TRINITY_DN11471_c0_g1~~TRINITY_DN11471_c0_g1_i4.p1  ORF type:complete len:862 (+),score=197.99 TRINITY_DN11471_c0_g1_i4:77-2662(+)
MQAQWRFEHVGEQGAQGWPESLQAPLRVTPQSLQIGNLGSRNDVGGRLGENSWPAEDGTGARYAVDPSFEPQQVDLSDGWAGVQQHNWLNESERQRQLMETMAQMLQRAGANGNCVGEGGLLHQTFLEIARRCSSAANATNADAPVPAASRKGQLTEAQASAAAADAPGSASAAAPAAAPVAAAGFGGSSSSTSRAVVVEEDASRSDTRRIEELSNYIRAQAQEYVEGQAEWGRQLAEVRGECNRDLDRVRREKEEVERQARVELLRLRQRLREQGRLEDEANGGSRDSSPNSTTERLGSWANAVSMDEHQQVSKRCLAAEDRIRDLEKYIKDHSVKFAFSADAQQQLEERDKEIQRLRSELAASTGATLRQTPTEALQSYQQQRLASWEHCARKILANAERVLGKVSLGEEGLEEGRFGRTATKLSLTLKEGKDGEVSNLRRLLKDALKNNGGKDDRTKRREAKLEVDDPGIGDGSAAAIAVACEDKVASPVAASPKVRSGRGSPSSASSRDSSPGAEGGSASPLVAGAQALEALSRMAADVRQLLASDQLQVPAAPPGSSAESSPRSIASCAAFSAGAAVATAGAATAPACQTDEQKQLLESVTFMRKSITQSIIAVERALRGLDRDLRGQCDELLGQEDLELPPDEEANSIPPTVAAEEEARNHVPLGEDMQLLSLVTLRLAQQQSSAALAEYVQLPHKLKAIFDLTKKLVAEVPAAHGASVMPSGSAFQQESPRVLHVGGPATADEDACAARAGDDRGGTQEGRLKAQILQLSQAVAIRDERLRTMEREQAQYVALLSHSAATSSWSRWPWVSGSPDAVAGAVAPAQPTVEGRDSGARQGGTGGSAATEWRPAGVVA